LSRSLKEYTIYNLYGWRFKMYRTLLSDMPHAWAGLRADRLGLRPTDANTSTLGRCSWVYERRAAYQTAFYTWQSLHHATALPIDGLHLKVGLHVDSFHGEIRTKSR
jgi:hypothetical protein